jgi:hypothetical protein
MEVQALLPHRVSALIDLQEAIGGVVKYLASAH